MNTPDPDRLMHLVLDGESTDEEARVLDRMMTADPALRERFDDLKRFFAQMRRVPDLEPPEELEHTILNEFNVQLRASRKEPDHSLKERNTMNQKPISDQDPTVTNQPALPTGNKKKVIVGATVAAVALLVTGSYLFDVPKDSASGTIAPAQRYRADQPTSGDIKLGGQAGKQGTSPTQAGEIKGAAQSGAGQSGAGQSGAGQSGAGQSGAGQSGAGGDTAQSGAGQSGAGQSGAGQSGAGQSGAGQSGAGQSGAGQSGAGQSGAGQSGAGQSGAGQSGAGQSGAGQSGTGQSGAGQSGAGQSGAGQSAVQSGSGRN